MRISDWSSDVCSSDLRLARHCGDDIARPLRVARRHVFHQPADADDMRARLAQRQRLHRACHRTRAAHIPFHFLHRSEEPTSELQSLMRISYAVFCLKKKNTKKINMI